MVIIKECQHSSLIASRTVRKLPVLIEVLGFHTLPSYVYAWRPMRKCRGDRVATATYIELLRHFPNLDVFDGVEDVLTSNIRTKRSGTFDSTARIDCLEAAAPAHDDHVTARRARWEDMLGELNVNEIVVVARLKTLEEGIPGPMRAFSLDPKPHFFHHFFKNSGRDASKRQPCDVRDPLWIGVSHHGESAERAIVGITRDRSDSTAERRPSNNTDRRAAKSLLPSPSYKTTKAVRDEAESRGSDGLDDEVSEWIRRGCTRVDTAAIARGALILGAALPALGFSTAFTFVCVATARHNDKARRSDEKREGLFYGQTVH